jgi:general secretion pathway protein C
MSNHNPTLIQRLPGFITPLLVMALSASLAKLLWMGLASPQDVAASPIPQAMSQTQFQAPQNFGQMIADTHLFGEVTRRAIAAPVVQQAPPPPAKPALPPVALSLHGLWAKKRSNGSAESDYKATLVDTTQAIEKTIVAKISADLDALFDSSSLFEPEPSAKPAPDRSIALLAKNAAPISDSKNKAIAVISQTGGEQGMYSEGDSITDDVNVVEIFVDKVVIDNRGVRQEIYLVDGETTETAQEAQSTSAESASIDAGQSSFQVNSNASSDPRKRGQNLGQQDLQKLREDVMNDVSLLAQFTAPEPLIMDGQVKGFRLHLTNRLRLLYQVGFRPGDVVTELNGVRLNDPSTVQQALYNFISADQLSISVMRGQEEETFRYEF